MTARRARVFDAMAARDLDVLVLGRQDDATYATGATRLWTAGTRPFGAGCVLVRATGRAHVLSSWDTGIPDDIPFDDLYPLTWNPQVMASSLQAIPGLVDAERIGVDALTPSFERAAAALAPGAELVPADDLLAQVRRIKDPDEIDAIGAACEVAWLGIDAALTGGLAAAVDAVCAAGATIPSSGIHVADHGDAVVVDVGVLVDGYEGGAGGRFTDRARGAAPPLVAACRAGAVWSDLAAVARSPDWCVRGLGRGYERPVITADLGHGERLDPGMVLSVTDGPYREVVHVTDAAPEILSARPADRPL